MAAKKKVTPRTPAKPKPKAAGGKSVKSARKPAAKAAKKVVAKKAAKKPAAKKAAAKKVAAKKPAAKKPAAKKAAARKVAAKKPAAKKAAVGKAAGKKPAARKAKVAKRAAAKEPVGRVAAKSAPRRVVPSSTPANGVKLTGFVAKQRQRLLDLRDELINSMYGVTRDTLRNAPEGSEASGSGMHQGDAGSDAYDRDFALSVLAKEQDALYEIEEALKRIQRGTYGVCEISGRKIPQARLEAIPFARLTVECQAEWEKEHGQRRFRPSSDIGFGGGQVLVEADGSTVSLDEEDE